MRFRLSIYTFLRMAIARRTSVFRSAKNDMFHGFVGSTHIKHLRTSSDLSTPDFSDSNFSTPSTENNSKASLISVSCSLVMLFSLARRVNFGFDTAFAGAAAFLFGAYRCKSQSHDLHACMHNYSRTIGDTCGACHS